MQFNTHMTDTLLSELNSKDSQIVIIDYSGVIRFVNDAWREFSIKHNSIISDWEGYNFFKIFDDARNQDLHREIVGILSGKISQMECQIDCGSDNIKRPYLLKAATIKAFDANCIVLEYIALDK